MLGFNLGGEEQRALAGRAGGFQSQIFSGGLVGMASRKIASDAVSRSVSMNVRVSRAFSVDLSVVFIEVASLFGMAL